ncbi:STAS domain-containing protein [Streptomyces roseolus]|uniref:STAS domain-containing protein n=1 Tax=Streptomyces roseolus TaxID=67358 RepID=UPI003790A0F3
MTDHVLTVSPQHPAPGVLVLVVDGELDHHTAPLLAAALDERAFAPGGRLVLDCAALTYCDSTGVTVFVTAYQRALATGCRLALAAVNEDLARVFRIMGLDGVFTFVPAAGDALREPDDR